MQRIQWGSTTPLNPEHSKTHGLHGGGFPAPFEPPHPQQDLTWVDASSRPRDNIELGIRRGEGSRVIWSLVDEVHPTIQHLIKGLLPPRHGPLWIRIIRIIR